MSYDDFEISNHGGRPVALYQFRWGNTIWRYTSADRAIDFPADVPFAPLAISDEGVKQTGSNQDDFTVTAPNTIPLADLFRSTPPSAPIWLTVRRKHPDDLDAPVQYVGKVANVKRREDGSAEIRCIAISAAYKKMGLRLTWDRNCPHILYDRGCRADKEAFKIEAEVTAIGGVEITVDALGEWEEAQYRGGFIEWDADGDGTMERRTIEASTGDRTFALLGRVDRLEVGMTISLFLGCDRTTEVCDSIFDNIVNYGGFPHMPGKSPFDGNQVF